MPQQADLLNIVNTLPQKYFGEIISFLRHLQHKSQQEAAQQAATEDVSETIAAREWVNPLLGLGTVSRIDPAEAVKRCSGIFKRLDIPLSSDDFLATKQQERELENRLDRSDL